MTAFCGDRKSLEVVLPMGSPRCHLFQSQAVLPRNPWERFTKGVFTRPSKSGEERHVQRSLKENDFDANWHGGMRREKGGGFCRVGGRGRAGRGGPGLALGRGGR